MSVERRNMLKAYGAELVLTEGTKGMSGAIAKANELAKETPNSFIPGQFSKARQTRLHTTQPPAPRSGSSPVTRLTSSLQA